jgi:hypothetical protein
VWGYYGGVTSGWASIIGKLARGNDVPVGVGPIVEIPEDHKAGAVAEHSRVSHHMEETSRTSSKRRGRARTDVNDGSQSGSVEPHGMKRKHQDFDGNSAKRMKTDVSR